MFSRSIIKTLFGAQNILLPFWLHCLCIQIFIFFYQLRNISKEMGPRGFNGTQGPAGAQGLPGLQGKPGVGNMSACIVDQKERRTPITTTTKVIVSYEQRPVRIKKP